MIDEMSLRARARQAARDQMADDRVNRDGARHSAALIRSGRWDDQGEVRTALAAADAVVDLVLAELRAGRLRGG